MAGVIGTGGTNIQMNLQGACFPEGNGVSGKQVSVKGNHIQVSTAAQETVLDAYREGGVDLELSGMARAEDVSVYTEEEIEKMKKDEAEKRLQESYQQQAKAAKEAAEGMSEQFGDLAKAVEIARRLMHGDTVPQSDEKFLMDFDKDMYLGAKSMQALAQNEDPKKYDSLLEDEEGEEGESSVSVDGGDAVIDASRLNLCTGGTEDGNVV